jgi:hypothetical protein
VRALKYREENRENRKATTMRTMGTMKRRRRETAEEETKVEYMYGENEKQISKENLSYCF